MTAAASWLLFPLVCLAVAAGSGLLLEAVSRTRVPDGLLAPLGAGLAVLVTLPVYLLDFGAEVAAPLLVVVALAGFVVRRRSVLRPLRGPAIWAGLAAYLLYLAPVLLSGHPTWAGYNFVNDPALNLLITDSVAHVGAGAARGGPSTATAAIDGTLATSYPLGAHAWLATLDRLVPGPLISVYLPFIACLAGFGAMAFTELGRAARLPSRWAAGAAVVAVGASVTYNYGLHGGFKELGLVACLATAVALARVALDAKLAPGAVALVAVPFAAAIAIISSAAGAYVLALAGVLLVTALVVEPRGARAGRAIGRAALVGAGVLIVAISPFLKDTIVFGRTATDQFSSTTGDPTSVLAHLVRPLPIYQALGPWLRDDYRYPLEPGALRVVTVILLVLAGALVVWAVVAETRRRRWCAVLALIPALGVYLLSEPRLSPYAGAKLLVALAPMVVFTALVGAWWLSQRARGIGLAAGVVFAAGVLASDAMAYHFTQLAPADRMDALADAVDHTGGGRWLSTEWEEYAKYYGRDMLLNVASESFSPKPADMRKPGPLFHRSFDLDELRLNYVESFDGLLLRRSPAESRPPANFRRVYANADYELWRRESAPTVYEHLPLGDTTERGAVPKCDDVQQLADRAELAGNKLVAAVAPGAPSLDPIKQADRPAAWGDAPTKGLVVMHGQGRIEDDVRFDAGGDYRVWVRASTERPLTVSVDGRDVGSVRGVNTPGQFLEAGVVRVGPGSHRVRLLRGGGSPAPGNGYAGELGPIVFEPVGGGLVPVAVKDAASLCGRSWDWIERVSVAR